MGLLYFYIHLYNSAFIQHSLTLLWDNNKYTKYVIKVRAFRKIVEHAPKFYILLTLHHVMILGK